MYNLYRYASFSSHSQLPNWLVLKPESGDENVIMTFSSPILRDENLLNVFSSPEMKTYRYAFSTLRDENVKCMFSAMVEIKTIITSFYLYRPKRIS